METGIDLLEWLEAFTLADLLGLGITVVVTVAAMVLVHRLLPPVLRRVSARLGLEYEQSAWRHLTAPLTVLIVLLGAWAVAVQLPIPEGWRETYHQRLSTLAAVLLTVLVFYGVLRLFNALAEQYHLRQVEGHDPRAVYVGLVRKIVNMVMIFVGLMLILGQLGYEIGPLVASLGIAGIAVALALQDTLGSMFSGFYLTFDQPVRPGDYIRLDSGEEGFVEQIGWRSTRIRPWQNNLVVIPNKKLAEAVITNFHLPEPEMSVYVWCGVDYGSDLEEVERVCIEEGNRLMRETEGGSREAETAVRFKEFQDSNISFVVVLRAVDPMASWRMQHEYVKALHRRFREESIEISWPVRKVVFPEGRGGSGQA